MELNEQISMAGKKLIITGGAQGIGRAMARMLIAEGAEVALVDINCALAKDAAAGFASTYSKKCLSIYCDVSNPQCVAEMMEEFIEKFGWLDGVFNNAGIAINKSALDTLPSEWQKVLDVNLSGIFYVAQAAARQFIKQGSKGSIVNMASMSGTIVNIPQKNASYNASKAAVVHLTKSLAVEWAEYGIRVNCISPGYIWTEMTANVRKDWQDIWMKMTPYSRFGKPEELAGAVLYLLSEAASYTSGSEIIIDGCYTCV